MNGSSGAEIETGSFAPALSALRPPRSVRVVDWNINRGLRLSGIIDFLSGAGADLIMLQECDLNARRTHGLNIAREIGPETRDELCLRSRVSGIDPGVERFSCIPRPGHALTLAAVQLSDHPI